MPPRETDSMKNRIKDYDQPHYVTPEHLRKQRIIQYYVSRKPKYNIAQTTHEISTIFILASAGLFWICVFQKILSWILI